MCYGICFIDTDNISATNTSHTNSNFSIQVEIHMTKHIHITLVHTKIECTHITTVTNYMNTKQQAKTLSMTTSEASLTEA